MTRRRSGFGTVDILIIVVVAAGLVMAAIYSERIVRRASDAPTDMPPPPIQWRDQFFGLSAPASGVLWMAGSGGKVVRSEDDGRSWSVQETGITENLQDIAAWDADRAVAAGNDGAVIVTADGGQSWAPVPVPRSEVANKLIRVRIQESGRAWAVGVMGMILSSEDWGASWQRRGEEVDVAWNDIAFADDDTVWVVGEFGSMMRSTDGGASWQEVEPASQRSLMAIAFRDSQTAVAVGLDGLVLRTSDAGLSWEPVDAGTTLHLFDVVWDGTSWIAVGAMGVVMVGAEDADSWQTQRVSDTDLAWHTELVPTSGGVYLAGASQGLWRAGEWTPAGSG
jgi:photosystem II stability/assembly factor-like uncharacterized protein